MSRVSCLLISAVLFLPVLVLFSRNYAMLAQEKKSPSIRESVLLVFFVVWGWSFVYGIFLWGNAFYAYRDTGIDTVDVYVPFYLDLLDSISSGTFGMWNYHYGLGASVLSYQSWLLDPFNLILVPLGLLLGSENLSMVLVLVQGARMVLAALLFNHLVARYCGVPIARILGSTCYAFCGFLMLWGQHYWLGSSSVLFAFMLLALERLMDRWNVSRFLTVVTAAVMPLIWSPYIGFAILLGAALYALLRLIHRAQDPHPVRSVLAGTFRLLVPVVCGCLCACITLVPYALYLFGETARTSSSDVSMLSRASQFLTEFVPFQWVPVILSRMLGTGLITTGLEIPTSLVAASGSFRYVNAYELVCLGFGGLSLVLLGQFADWAYKEAESRDRLLIAISVVLIALYCVNAFLPALFNLLIVPKYRSSFILAVPICIAISLAWEHRVVNGSVARMPLRLYALASLTIVIWSFRNSVDGQALCIFYALGIAVFWLLFELKSVPQRFSHSAVLGLGGFLLVVGCILSDAYFVNTNREYCIQENFPGAAESRTSDSREAIEYAEGLEDGFYRIEKTYTDWGLYNDALVQEYCGVSSYNSTGTYRLSRFYQQLWPDVLQAGGAVQNFRNDPDALGIASWLGVRYLVSESMQDASQFELMDQFGPYYVYRVLDSRPLLEGFSQMILEKDADARYTIDERRELIQHAIIVDGENAAVGVSETDGEADLSTSNVIRAHLELDSGQVLQGSFSASQDAVACLKVPYAEGWHVYIDGVERSVFAADYGFIGFAVSAGEHDIKAFYIAPGLDVGMVVSLLGVCISAVCCLVGGRLTQNPRRFRIKQLAHKRI